MGEDGGGEFWREREKEKEKEKKWSQGDVLVVFMEKQNGWIMLNRHVRGKTVPVRPWLH